jgi:hypothetical protein
MSLGKEYLSTVIKRLKYYKELGEKTFEQLEEKDLHYLPTSESNSVAIIVQHLAGNMLSRFTNFLTEDGEKEWRQRDDEFEIHNYTKQQVIDLWNKGWQCCFEALESITENDLLTMIYIRKEPLSVIDAYQQAVGTLSLSHWSDRLYRQNDQKREWKNLSIPKGQSQQYNAGNQVKDPAKKY